MKKCKAWVYFLYLIKLGLSYARLPTQMLTPFFDTVGKGDFDEEKMADLEETKRCTMLESADEICLMD